MAKNKSVSSELIEDSIEPIFDVEPLDNQKAEPKLIDHDDPKHENEVLMRMNSPLDEAGRSFLHKQFEKLQKAQKAIEDDANNPDGVHDMRVATRRLRSAFKVLQGTVYDPKATAPFLKSLKQMTAVLGEVRDTDVFCEHLNKHKAELPGSQLEGLEPLEQRLKRNLSHAQAKLSKTLHKRKTEHLLAELQEFVKKPGAGVLLKGKNLHAVKPFLVRHFVASTVWQSYEEVLAYEKALSDSSIMKVPTFTLHRLRIAIKNLRYTLEFFTDALPPSTAAIIEQLTATQDYLGELHDHDVAVTTCSQLLKKQPDNAALQTYRDQRAAKRDELQLAFSEKWAELTEVAFRRKLGLLLS